MSTKLVTYVAVWNDHHGYALRTRLAYRFLSHSPQTWSAYHSVRQVFK